jgi:hypothetical protein
VIWKSIPLPGATSPISITESLPDIPEPPRLIRIISSIRPRPGHGRSSFFPISPSVLPPDQAHVHKSEDHAGDGEADFDAGAAGVAGTFGGGEEVAGADAGWLGETFLGRWDGLTRRLGRGLRREVRRLHVGIRCRRYWRTRLRLGGCRLYTMVRGVFRRIGKLGCWQ